MESANAVECLADLNHGIVGTGLLKDVLAPRNATDHVTIINLGDGTSTFQQKRMMGGVK